MEKLEFNVLNYEEFNKLVNENILAANNQYNFIAYEELPNDIAKAYHVKPLDETKHYDSKYSIPEIESGKLMFRGFTILCYLCYKKIIEPGNYLITVSW